MITVQYNSLTERVLYKRNNSFIFVATIDNKHKWFFYKTIASDDNFCFEDTDNIVITSQDYMRFQGSAPLQTATEEEIDAWKTLYTARLNKQNNFRVSTSDEYEYYEAVISAFELHDVNFNTCTDCGRVLPVCFIDATTGMCFDCISRDMVTCVRCGDYFRKKPFNITREGRFLCSECSKRKYVLPYHRDYPQLNFFGSASNGNIPLYLGVELEVDDGGEKDRECGKILDIFNKNDIFAYCSHDSSLHNGFEIITQPATLTYHNSIKHIYKQVFDILLEDGYVSHDTSTCGLHIHFNRNFYADNEELYISRLLYLVDKFWDDIVRISRRNKRRMDYTRKIDMPIERYINRTNKTGDHDYHYYAVNLINNSTIEFRMFRGTLNVQTYLATLQFVQNCILTAKEKSAEEIQRMSFDDLITGRNLASYWKKRKGVQNTEE